MIVGFFYLAHNLPSSTARPLERPGWIISHLAALAQIMIGDDARHHGFPDRYRTDADTGVVTALGADFGLGAVAIDGAARSQD
jgi:hypothetical protein